MKDDSLLLPIRFEVHFEIVLIDEMEELEGLFKVETSYALFTSVRDDLEMGWRWIGDDWIWISNSGCINDPISTTRLEIGSLLKKYGQKQD